MSKYVIELDDRIKIVTSVGVTENGVVYTTSDYVHNLEELNSDYINEHFGDLQDTTYQKGFEDGKAVNDKGCEGCKYQANGELTCPCSECANNFKNQWTAKDDRIEVGDEVEPFYTDITGVVTLIDGDTIYVLWRDGSSTSTLKLKEVTKTGRHFNIDKILEEMKHD